jgi:hypothetical protein
MTVLQPRRFVRWRVRQNCPFARQEDNEGNQSINHIFCISEVNHDDTNGGCAPFVSSSLADTLQIPVSV